jgi:hypothetical protein
MNIIDNRKEELVSEMSETSEKTLLQYLNKIEHVKESVRDTFNEINRIPS